MNNPILGYIMHHHIAQSQTLLNVRFSPWITYPGAEPADERSPGLYVMNFLRESFVLAL